MEATYNVFYSWQSDLPRETNNSAIRLALRACFGCIENIKEIKINLDEATRDMPGSPNIPQSIFGKIDISDVFVCDITTINQDEPHSKRAVPNPNVLRTLSSLETPNEGQNNIEFLSYSKLQI